MIASQCLPQAARELRKMLRFKEAPAMERPAVLRKFDSDPMEARHRFEGSKGSASSQRLARKQEQID